ncbi:MAG: hypothetical protein NTW59_02830 [Candidatus Diapherotrites archaeon]|nr:hypothetical protein [Candidatus Diapherotrites archaeon]
MAALPGRPLGRPQKRRGTESVGQLASWMLGKAGTAWAMRFRMTGKGPRTPIKTALKKAQKLTRK